MLKRILYSLLLIISSFAVSVFIIELKSCTNESVYIEKMVFEDKIDEKGHFVGLKNKVKKFLNVNIQNNNIRLRKNNYLNQKYKFILYNIDKENKISSKADYFSFRKGRDLYVFQCLERENKENAEYFIKRVEEIVSSDLDKKIEKENLVILTFENPNYLVYLWNKNHKNCFLLLDSVNIANRWEEKKYFDLIQ